MKDSCTVPLRKGSINVGNVTDVGNYSSQREVSNGLSRSRISGTSYPSSQGLIRRSLISVEGDPIYRKDMNGDNKRDDGKEIPIPEVTDISSYAEKYEEWEMNRKPSSLSFYLNLFIMLFQNANYYAVVPSGPTYVERLGGDDNFSGILLAVLAVTALISSIGWTFMLKFASFKTNMLMACALSLAGNLLTGLAASTGELYVLVLARVLTGLGVCQSLQSEWISRAVGENFIRKASQMLGTADAMGAPLGAAIAAASAPINEHVLELYFDKDTLPGWFVAFVYIFITVFVLFAWEDPEIAPKDPASDGAMDNTHPPISWTSGLALYIYAFPAASTCFALSVLEGSAPLVAKDEFDWGVLEVSIFLGVIGLVYLPISFIFNYLIDKMEDRKYLLFIHGVCLSGMIVLFKYPSSFTTYQYSIGALITFSSVAAGISAALALLSKVNPINDTIMFNTGTVFLVSTSYGRCLGSVYSTAFPNDPNQENIVMAGGTAVYVLSLLICVLTYKPLGRLLKKS